MLCALWMSRGGGRALVKIDQELEKKIRKKIDRKVLKKL
jgi:hypothetical protein